MKNVKQLENENNENDDIFKNHIKVILTAKYIHWNKWLKILKSQFVPRNRNSSCLKARILWAAVSPEANPIKEI